MADIIIGTKNYIFGNGKELNRQIQFVRNGGPNSIQARVCLLNPKLTRIATLPGNLIKVAMQSTSQQVMLINTCMPLKEDQPLSNLTVAQQNDIMSSLHERRIEVIHEYNPSQYAFEKVISLKIIDPK